MESINQWKRPVYHNRAVAKQSGIKELTDCQVKMGWLRNGFYKIFPGNWFSEFTNITVSLEEFGTHDGSKKLPRE